VSAEATAGIDPEYERLMAFAVAHPKDYERGVVLRAVLGYAYLVAALLAVVGLAVGLAAFLLWWRSLGHPTGIFAFLWMALAGLAVSIAHAFTITPPKPQGTSLARQDAPELFRLIDELVIGARATRVHEVLLVDGVHAACVQIRRFGLVGPTRRYLLVGVTTLLAVTPDEFQAILAHEIGHLSMQRGRSHAWAYGVRETWIRFFSSLHERRSILAGVFARLIGGYLAQFARYSFVLARQQEIDADRFGGTLCGSRTMGDALVRLAMAARVMARAAEVDVGVAALREMGPAARAQVLLHAEVASSQRERDLGAVLAEPAALGDPHPPLAERLRVLGVTGRVLDVAAPSAAQRYLGSRADELLALVHEAGGAVQKDRAIGSATDELAAPKSALARLEGTHLDSMSTDDLRRRAQLTDVLRGGRAALPVYAALAARGDALGHFGIGKLRLATGDESGLGSLDRVIELDKELAVAAASIAADFLAADGRAELAARYGRIADEHGAELEAIFEARTSLSVADDLTPHDLPGDLVTQVVAALARVTPVARAYLVKKVTNDRPDMRAYFLAVVYGTAWFLRTEQEDVDIMTGRLQEGIAALSPDITVVVVNRYRGRKEIEVVNESLIYDRPPESVPAQVLPRWGRRAQKLVLVVSVLYLLWYVFLVANLQPQFNSIAGPIVLAPLLAIVVGLFWSLRDEGVARRIAGLAAVSGLLGMLAGAYLTETEWSSVLLPVVALGLFRPPSGAPRLAGALVVALGALGGLAVRVFAHIVLVG